MNKLGKFIKLDFITVKPYMTVKNILIFTGVALIMALSSNTVSTAVSMLMVYASLYVTYPFAVGEKNGGIDILYATLSVGRGTVVLGRYLFSQAVNLCGGIFAFTFSVLMSRFKTTLLYDGFFIETLVVVIVMFLIFGFVQAIQLPFFFKLGYLKAKIFTYMPFLVIGLAFGFVYAFMNDDVSNLSGAFAWLTANPVTAVILAGAAWLGVMAASYAISLAFYKKREF